MKDKRTGSLDNNEFAARLTVIERAIVNLAILVEGLRQDAVDAGATNVVASSHEPTTMD